MNDVRRAAGGLHLLTIESLLSDLVGGRAVPLDGGRTLAFDDASRSVLGWYRDNCDKWSGQMRGDDAHAIVDAVRLEPPSLEPQQASGGARPPRVLRLVGCERIGSRDFTPSNARRVRHGRSSSSRPNR